ncbi:TAP-like protein [Parafrankia irregularis]|uniref:TAP-like protein n=1 Tax=Parafrankia irregularis TaxID=795642 RepID=A0A0S4R2R3_9ACTN|nr:MULTISPECIES: alpha/beta fold hydrolase [Parafrankia]CUU61050.1 TAP-like protein [Parafrankia irregularis]
MTAVALAAASLVGCSPAAGSSVAATESAGAGPVTIRWEPCRAYSDDVLRDRGISEDKLPAARALLNRLECGSVSVPLDYRSPNGRRITVAITRLPAVDQANRLGSLALNPGGPGGGGYLMPVEVSSLNDAAARLNARYDLIGFDPRGVGYSSKVQCALGSPGGASPAPTGQPGPETGQPGPETGPLTEAAARGVFEQEAAANGRCGRSDPDFLGELTTLNVARDLDLVRRGLGERRLNFLGVSWGTWLGMVYRSTFPDSVGRMFLDSVALPTFSVTAFEDGRADAIERNFARMAEWLAARNASYGFGMTKKQVRAAILALVQDYDAHPRRFTDLPQALDGAAIARLASQTSPDWARAGLALRELRDATGPTAPTTAREILAGAPRRMTPDAPEHFNITMNQAVFCNEDPSRLDFASAWAAYQQRVQRNPVTGRAGRFSAGCAGWPLPVQEFRPRRDDGSLVLAGHRYEQLSPFQWTTQTHAAVGGTVFTVNDDVHGSVLKDPDCAADLVGYFITGRIDRGCTGVRQPA